MTDIKVLLIGVVALSLTACEPAQNRASEDESVKSAHMRAEMLNKMGSIEGRLNALDFMIEFLRRKSVEIDAVTHEYQSIDTNSGRFLIECDNVQPYLDGQKLQLRVGNPNLATYRGFKLKAKWGPRTPKWDSADALQNASRWDEWKRSLREKEIESTADLKPGVWNTVEIVLAPAKPDELGYIELSMTTDKIILYQDRTP